MGKDPFLGEIEGFDPEAPCELCEKPVVMLSMAGPGICPWCDIGRPEQRPAIYGGKGKKDKRR